MNIDKNKAIALALLFTLFFCFFLNIQILKGDYPFHYEKAKNGCANLEEDYSCGSYAPLFHWLAQPFVFHENAFFYFTIILFAFVTPMLLYYITRHWIVVWFYFSTNAYYWTVLDGIFSQGLAVILLLLLIALQKKDWRIQALIVVVSITSHGHGFFLVAGSFLILQFWKIVQNDLYKLKKHFAKIFLGCTGVFGKQGLPEILNIKIQQFPSVWQHMTIGNFLLIFTKIFPLPYFYFSIKKLLHKKESTGLVLIALMLFVTGFWIQERIFYIIPLVLLPGLAWYYEDLSRDKKILFVLSTLVIFAIQIYIWVNIRFVCS